MMIKVEVVDGKMFYRDGFGEWCPFSKHVAEYAQEMREAYEQSPNPFVLLAVREWEGEVGYCALGTEGPKAHGWPDCRETYRFRSVEGLNVTGDHEVKVVDYGRDDAVVKFKHVNVTARVPWECL